MKAHFSNLPQTVVNYLVDSKTYIACFLGFICYAIAMLFEGTWVDSIIASGIATSLLIARLKIEWCHYSLSLIALISGVGVMLDSTLGWLVISSSPLIFFFVTSVRLASMVVGGLTLLTLALLAYKAPELTDGQILMNYLLCLTISVLYVYLRESKQKELQPLRRTDQLTAAAASEYLYEDLTKEVQRTEREGSTLSVVALGIDQDSISTLSESDLENVIVNIGRLLHNNLRLFDSYYRWDSHQYLIVLPHTSSSQAHKIANNLRVKIRQDIQSSQEAISVSTGIAGLNVGDNAETLTVMASETLRQVQSQGKNSSAIYEHDDDASDSEPNQ